MKIACWSGPRNLSTAMMYAFAAGGFSVWDEPFYGAYLSESGADHPMRTQVMEDQPTDPRAVAAELARPGEKPCYFKLMAHHMLDGFPLDWAADCAHVHLIRHPARVIASYGVKRAAPTLEDIGFPQQMALIRRLGGVVIDSFDIRRDPRAALGGLCEAIGLPFSERMLSWSPGPKPFDGVWATHWYDAVHISSGFAGPEGSLPDVPEDALPVLEQALPLYETMRKQALT